VDSRSGRLGITPASILDVDKSNHPVERRKSDRPVGLDRRRHDDDFAERMTGGIRTWSPERSERSPFIKKHIHK